MERKVSITAIAMSLLVAIYLIIEFTNPVSSLALAVSAVALSVAGFACAYIGVRRSRTPLGIAAMVFGSIVMVIMLLIFMIWFIMGMGA